MSHNNIINSKVVHHTIIIIIIGKWLDNRNWPIDPMKMMMNNLFFSFNFVVDNRLNRLDKLCLSVTFICTLVHRDEPHTSFPGKGLSQLSTVFHSSSYETGSMEN
ncbi:hypothetical protein BLOT_002878 [Blomia tropicalis]|nr:hypothetical protein BLOT_002878 [Blomia tropicalis]